MFFSSKDAPLPLSDVNSCTKSSATSLYVVTPRSSTFAQTLLEKCRKPRLSASTFGVSVLRRFVSEGGASALELRRVSLGETLVPRDDGRRAGGSMATGGGFGAVGVSGGGGGTGAFAFGAFGVGGGWTYDAGNKLSASTRPSSLATLPKPVASISLTKSLFSMACLVLRVSASTLFALAEPGASGECSPVRSGRCAFWCGQHALGDVS